MRHKVMKQNSQIKTSYRCPNKFKLSNIEKIMQIFSSNLVNHQLTKFKKGTQLLLQLRHLSTIVNHYNWPHSCT
uniref:Uncharacterized protein MANES_04G043800 n=1 Tax=Rhizophora mucronata TaxID=61149 RepID=A0A2P2MI77_RHIMU